MLVRSLRWVPPTTALASAEDNEEASLLALPGHRSCGRQDFRTNGREKQGPYILGLNAEALRPRFGNKILSQSSGPVPAVFGLSVLWRTAFQWPAFLVLF